MGKKKKKKQQDFYMDGDGIFNQSRNNEIADHLEAYIDAVENLFILEGKKESDVKASIKIIKKACKDLREGRPEKVFDEERYNYLLEEEGIDFE